MRTINDQVEIARNRLARELRMRGAEVAFVTWDIALGKGIDDLLATVGPERMLEALEGVDFENAESDKGISTHQIAEAITAKHRFAKDAGKRLYLYQSGCYYPNGASFVASGVTQNRPVGVT